MFNINALFNKGELYTHHHIVTYNMSTQCVYVCMCVCVCVYRVCVCVCYCRRFIHNMGVYIDMYIGIHYVLLTQIYSLSVVHIQFPL